MPIRFFRAHYDYHFVLALYSMADVIMGTSLHDGMNLVAKEFFSARTDGDGGLLLSTYIGVARKISHALLVNPFDVDELADAMYDVFHMPEVERRKRMRRMRAQVQKNTVYDWGMEIFEEFGSILPSKEVA